MHEAFFISSDVNKENDQIFSKEDLAKIPLNQKPTKISKTLAKKELLR